MLRRFAKLLLLALVSCVIASPSLVHAQTATEAKLEARAAELDRSLSEVQGPASTYFTAWLIAMSATAAIEGTAAFLVDDAAQRDSLLVGAGLSVVGVAALLLTPLPGRSAADELHGMPSASSVQKRARVARGEELLEAEAESVRFRRAWFQHVLVGVLATGNAVFLGVRHPDDIARVVVPSTLGLIVVSELQIFTRPTAGETEWEGYQKRHPRRGSELGIVIAPWCMTDTGAGVSVSARF